MKNLFGLYSKIYLLIAFLCVFTSVSSQIIEAKSISCPGANDGQLNVHSVWGIPPYSYAWTKNTVPFGLATDSIVKGAGPGNYSVTVTDNAATSFTFNYTLSDPAALSNSFVTTPNGTWPATNGSFTITTTGGSGWVKYTVKDSISRKILATPGPTYTGLPSGKYFITTSDAHGCSRSDKVVIAETSPFGEIGTNFSGIINPDTTACFRDITLFGVTPDTIAVFPITALVDNLAPQQLIGYKSPGDSLRLHTGPATTMLVDTMLPAAGWYFVKALLAPNAGETLQRVQQGSFSANLGPGFHMVTVYTANGRGFRYSWDVDSVTSPLTIKISNLVNNPCFGDALGQITATAEGSYERITLTLSGNGITPVNSTLPPAGENAMSTVSRVGLTAGIYTLTARDGSSECVAYHEVEVTQPDEALRIVWDKTKNARCPYSLDGAASIRRVDGAIGNINFSWSNGENTPNLSNILPGTYILTVTDANGCTGSDSIKVEGERRNCFYNIITPNGDGYNDKFDLSDFCVGVQMKAVIFNEAGKLVATLDENNPTWDAYDASLPPTGTSSTYTCFVSLYEDGVKTVEFAESFSVVFPQ